MESSGRRYRPSVIDQPNIQSNSPFAAMARNHIGVTLITVSILLIGVISVLNITVERYPPFNLHTISINVPYPDATPYEVEEDILRQIEKSLVAIDGIVLLTSNAWDERAEVLVEFKQFTDMIDKLDVLRTAVDSIEDFPPPGADEPEVAIKTILRNVLTLAISSSTVSEQELRKYADDVRASLLLLPSVSIVDLAGARVREIQVDLDEHQLQQFGLSVQDVARRIASVSVNVSGGEIRSASGDVVISVLDQRVTAEQFNDIVIISRADGSLVHLGDIATLRDSFVDDPLVSFVNGEPAILIDVTAQPTDDPRVVIDEVETFLANHEPPAGIHIQHWLDRVYSVHTQLATIAKGAVLGGVLVFITLILLFDFRVSFWVTLGIPTTLLGACVVMHLLGLSINVMVILGISAVIGIVVDDAIVVGENIARHQEQGEARLPAAIRGAREVMGPVIVGVVTTMVAFAALIPLDGTLGQMFSALGVMVVIVLILSLFDAFFLLPGHLSSSWPNGYWPLSTVQQKTSSAFQQFINVRFTRVLDAAARHPWVTIGATALVILCIPALVFIGLIKFEATGTPLDERQLQVDLTMAVGTPFEETQAATQQVLLAAFEADDATGGKAIDGTNVTIGQFRAVESIVGLDVGDALQHQSTVQLRLNPSDIRDISVEEFKQVWLEKIGVVPGASRLEFTSSYEGTAANLSFSFMHPDETSLLAAASELKERLNAHPYVYEIEDTLERGKIRNEITLTEAGKSARLTPAMLALQLKHRYYGIEVDQVVRDQTEIEVMTRYPLERTLSQRDLADELILLPNGEFVALGTVATIEQTQNYAQRQRINGLPAATFAAYYNQKMTTTGELSEVVIGEWFTELASLYPGLTYIPAGSSRENAKSFGSLAVTFPIALVIIFVLVTVQLRSFLQPLLVFLCIPIAIAGALYLHAILGYLAGLSSYFGIVAVCGVVINDALVLLDMFNNLRREEPELSVREAIVRSARLRARPVLITSLTTIVGLMPLIYMKAESVVLLLPIFVSLIGGLGFGSIGLLFFLPATVVAADGIATFLRQRALVAAQA
ncbi:MAG: efflux RND transporter permease subunit [Gammaproteobacteria bacterium]|nr:efflux RND transporter permease subunit [Gammaproteobacteria bacterium]